MLIIKSYAHILKYPRISKISAHAQNICAHLEISVHIQNICSHLKYLRICKIYAPHLKYLRISKIYVPHLKYLRISKIYAPHHIRQQQGGRWNLCAYEEYMRPSEIGAQTLTIWARQNLQLLTSSKSGWRALAQVMLSLLHAVLKWSLHPGRPAYCIWVASLPYCTSCCTGTTCQNICVLSKYLRPHIFLPFPGEKSKT